MSKRNHLKSAVTEKKNQKKAHLKVSLPKAQLSKIKTSKKKRNRKVLSHFIRIIRKWRMIGKISKRRKKTNAGLKTR